MTHTYNVAYSVARPVRLCPLHNAAPELLAMLEELTAASIPILDRLLGSARAERLRRASEAADALIRKARGGNGGES
jgi:hypothetical protein